MCKDNGEPEIGCDCDYCVGYAEGYNEGHMDGIRVGKNRANTFDGLGR